jgi:hypothetical protein
MAPRVKEILTDSGLSSRARENVVSEGCLGLLVDDLIQDEEARIRSKGDVLVCPDNSLPGYGVKKKDITDSFKPRYQGDINYSMLRQILYGLNYVEIEGEQGVPHEMLSAMNTSEVLSLYRGFTKLIERGKLPTDKGSVSLDDLKEMSAEEVVSKIVGYGCKRKAMGAMQKKGHTKFPTKPYDLIKRIKPLSEKVKAAFMKLLESKRKTTQLTTPERGSYDFHDPCYDGWDLRKGLMRIRGIRGKGLYASSICSFLGGLYKRNTKR